MIKADLHVHTYYSDGLLSPSDVIAAAKANGVEMISVTDHDNMNGSTEVAALAKEAGIYAVDGIEISAYADVKVHMLGYRVNTNCPAYRRFYIDSVGFARERTKDILAKLESVDVNLTMEEIIDEMMVKSAPIHAMHIARAGAKKGYSSSATQFFLDYLNVGKVAYSSICRPTPERAIEVIKSCGGICSLAHPGRIALDKDDKLKLIDRLCKSGLDGIEAIYSGHTDSDTALFKEIAKSKNLYVTGGSDIHCNDGNRTIGKPEFYPDAKLLAALKID
jgi:hypothetical protein